ncbi:MAG: hypothetical protein H0W06_07785, partial [Chloroflexia bacterium]|nr:hypothetical protein [Chloroflexia bacterium]
MQFGNVDTKMTSTPNGFSEDSWTGKEMLKVDEVTAFLKAFDNPPPRGTDDFPSWARNIDGKAFLHGSLEGDVPVFVSLDHAYIDTVLVDRSKLVDNWRDELLNWNFGASEGWSLEAREGQNATELDLWLVFPRPYTGWRDLEPGETLVFQRFFPGLPPRKSYLELNQRLIQASSLHWRADRGAFSRLDAYGDFADLIHVRQLSSGHLCLIHAEILGKYMLATNQALVRVFDFHRCDDWKGFSNYRIHRTGESVLINESALSANIEELHESGLVVGSLLRGVQVVEELISSEQLATRLSRIQKAQNRQASFIAQELPTSCVGVWPPEDGPVLPFQKPPDPISPAYFKAEVLSKYKQHPDRYAISGSTIDCRGSWSLFSDDVNDEGQVYAYLKDLWTLPYEEQLYWKSFNEPPRAGITHRSFSQDFMAVAWTGYDPLVALRDALDHFPTVSVNGTNLAVWSDRGKRIHELLS